jgi:hypothetical protein
VAIFQALYVGAPFRVLVNGGRPTHGRLVASGGSRSEVLPCFSIRSQCLMSRQICPHAPYGIHPIRNAIRLDV